MIGLSDSRNAQAELALLPADRVVPKPDALGWDVAATLYVAGTTAQALLQEVPVGAGRHRRRSPARPAASACS